MEKVNATAKRYAVYNLYQKNIILYSGISASNCLE